MDEVRADLIAEQHCLDDIVSDLQPDQWDLRTACAGWSVADQIGHLSYFDNAASIAIADPSSFSAMVSALWDAAERGGESAVDELVLGGSRTMDARPLLDAWRESRVALAAVSASLRDTDRVNWYGPAMGSKSFLTARLMECWAHGRDIAAAVGAAMPPTDRLAHIARLGFITRAWSYTNSGRDAPTEPISVELVAPSGAPWLYGDRGATEWVRGDAEQFCLVVTQRAHIDDTDLDASPLGREWLVIAQAFAGPPTTGPAPATLPRR